VRSPKKILGSLSLAIKGRETNEKGGEGKVGEGKEGKQRKGGRGGRERKGKGLARPPFRTFRRLWTVHNTWWRIPPARSWISACGHSNWNYSIICKLRYQQIHATAPVKKWKPTCVLYPPRLGEFCIWSNRFTFSNCNILHKRHLWWPHDGLVIFKIGTNCSLQIPTTRQLVTYISCIFKVKLFHVLFSMMVCQSEKTGPKAVGRNLPQI
jgi:hypothetical protein